MKRLIVLEVLRRLIQHPRAGRKLKVFFAIGAVTLMLAAGLLVWGTVAAFQLVAGVGQEIDLPRRAEALKTEVQQAPALLQAGCLERAKDFLSIQVWLEEPLGRNLHELKSACFREKPCEGVECEPQKQEQSVRHQRIHSSKSNG